jgi:hypothetical protein
VARPSEKKSRQSVVRFDPSLERIIEETMRRHLQPRSVVIRAAVHLLGEIPLDERRALIERYLFPKPPKK